MKDKRVIIYLIAAATALKFILLFFISGIRLWEDHDIALNFLDSGELFYISDGAKFFTYQFPVYPFLLAGIYTIFGISPLAAVAFNVLLNGLAAIIIYLFIQDFMQYFLSGSSIISYAEKIAAACSLVFLLHPAINYYALYNIHPFSIDLLFLFLSLWLMMRFVLNPSRKNLVFYAVVLGITILDRASLVVVLLPFLIISYKCVGFGITLKRFSIIVVISSFVVAPWLVRNYYKEGIIGFESSIAKDLWKGSMPEGEGSSYLVNGKNYYSALSKEEKGRLYKMGPKEQHDFFTNKYLELLIETPGHVLKMYFIKLKNFWWFREKIGNDYEPAIQNFIPYYKIYYVVIFFFSIISLFVIRGSVTLFSVPFVLSMLQSIFYVETRHRMIIEPLLIFLSILAITELFLRYRVYDKFDK